ncbi:hypothetical protein TNCT_545121 [Trichonephila clavata]|uniref:Uncharacterized protein n=1 Tax=Trichonephila clavata TaxID=2740835 RepID=A0A8X6M2J5_TRICU|nr:hypothetical protein TNCT_632411 [Trichonephila clavata]GFR29602.1 hypothetical protein TNCT_545121 [Trichonephila clavata]
MDLPPPVSQKAYEKILRKINLASCEVADDSMKNAAKEEILASGSNEICTLFNYQSKSNSRFGQQPPSVYLTIASALSASVKGLAQPHLSSSIKGNSRCLQLD